MSPVVPVIQVEAAVNVMEAILVYCRHPEAGTTKTRLIPRLGDEGAAHLYRHLAESVTSEIRTLHRDGLRRVLLVEPAGREQDVRGWLGEDFESLPQVSGDLGDKLRAGFHDAFVAGAERVVAVGTDCVDIGTDLLGDAFDLLKNNDAVLGPALDGGYYLVGLSREITELFTDIPWSTEQVFAESCNRLKLQGATLAILDERSDIDTPEDLDTIFPDWPIPSQKEAPKC